jgi:hypothetical protein
METFEYTIAPEGGEEATDPTRVPFTQDFDINFTAIVDEIGVTKTYPDPAKMIYGVGAGNVAIPDPNPLGYAAGDVVPDFIKLIQVARQESADPDTIGNPLKCKMVVIDGYGKPGSIPYYPNLASLPANMKIRLNPTLSLGADKCYTVFVAGELPEQVISPGSSE